ncbi:MFS transporter [Actinosynnema sp. NPDC020468]|uniref:MFS transporter n=1 Tax=Actinosynnema sp. NPDC020468 TaxID=3154488 RepID=UPI0033F234FD
MPVVVLMLGAVVVVAQLYLTVPLLPGVADRYGVSLAAASWVGGGFGLAFAVGSLVFGTASDRFDRRHVMVGGVVAGAVACVVAGAAPSFEVLLVVRVVQGFAAAAFPSVALAHVAEAVPVRRRAVAVTAVSSCFLVAGLVGQGFALLVDHGLGWHWVFWLMAPVLLVVAFAVSRLPATGRAVSGGSVVGAFRELLGRRELLVGYAGAVTLLLTFVGMYTAFNAEVAHRYGITEAADLLLLRLPGLPGILLGAFAGPMITRFGAHRVAGLAFAAATAGLAAEATATSLWLLLLGSAVYVAGLAVTIPALIAIVGQAGGDHRGTALAGYGFLVGLGGGAGPVVVTTITGFAPVCLTLAAVTAVAGLVVATGPRVKV